MGIAETLLITNRVSNRDAALVFARGGFPIFPCFADGKRPLTGSGFHEATRDTDQVSRWWNRWPRANIGMPTGQASGIDVVDIDVTGAGSGFDTIEHATHEGLLTGELGRVRTPSGGLHIYFPADPSQDQRCWQAASAHIDFRGNGGYVIVPPSTLLKDRGRVGYHLFSLATSGGTPIDAAALRRFVDPRPIRAGDRPPAVRGPEPSRLARWVGNLQEGERNRGLFWAASRLAEAGFGTADIEDALAAAAASVGLPSIEASSTIRSATRRAISQPFAAPDPNSREHEAANQRRGDAQCLP